MKKLNLNDFNLRKDEILSRMQMKQIGGGYVDGIPGGDNGNPCPDYCEPVGGSIFCTGYSGGVNYIYDGNCNEHPYNPDLHNLCINEANGDFWC